METTELEAYEPPIIEDVPLHPTQVSVAACKTTTVVGGHGSTTGDPCDAGPCTVPSTS
jgi:hypothetical protein